MDSLRQDSKTQRIPVDSPGNYDKFLLTLVSFMEKTPSTKITPDNQQAIQSVLEIAEFFKDGQPNEAELLEGKPITNKNAFANAVASLKELTAAALVDGGLNTPEADVAINSCLFWMDCAKGGAGEFSRFEKSELVTKIRTAAERYNGERMDVAYGKARRPG